jgi:hypothetical protein
MAAMPAAHAAAQKPRTAKIQAMGALSKLQENVHYSFFPAKICFCYVLFPGLGRPPYLPLQRPSRTTG